jgi:putative transposase
MKLNLRITRRKRLPKRFPSQLAEPTAPNQTWSMDFMSDALLNGQRIRTLNVIDDFNREVLAIEVDTSLPAQRVIRVLEQIADWHGYPARIRIDNGPEFISTTLMGWAQDHAVLLDFIQPGQPAQNAYIERFNRTYREEVLDFYLFQSVKEVHEITQRWMSSYHQERPHDALHGMTPAAYRLAAS